MDPAYQTLFYPFESRRLDKPEERWSVLFLNAESCSGLKLYDKKALFLQQYFKPDAARLQSDGYAVQSALPEEGGFDLVLLAAPRNVTEAQYLLAHGAKHLKQGGVLLCAAANNAGGGRLKKLLENLRFGGIQQESKNKARVVWARKELLDEKILEEWIAGGSVQKVLDGRFVSQPGIFGWDKIDKGSEILTRSLPEGLSGSGADFGCGYGYLSDHVLKNNPEIKNFSCIDADYRAVQCARQNLQHYENVRYFWEDLTEPVAGLEGLDFIIMNPPFHEGRIADPTLGKAFIGSAYAALKPGGRLYMVANAKLPYEEVLQQLFSSFEKKYEGESFKIFEALR